MARSPFPDPSGERLPPTHSDLLLDVAERSILDGLGNRRSTVPPLDELPDELRRPVGAFVTLNVHGRLNGCIGSIETDDALAVGVARHAWSAAFSDPRLPALRWVDYEHLDIEISILSPLAPMVASS
jgi:AMMECR1 domain-containing protein